MIAVQSILAGALVLASALYATWRLMRPRTRLSLVRGCARFAPQLGGRWLAQLAARAAPDAASGCESCSAGAAKRHLTR
jgi:hypothetical protein